MRTPDGAYWLEDLQLRELRPHEVSVRVVGVGICHTDVLPASPSWSGPPPIGPGHEVAGVVEPGGASVTAISVGDHVVRVVRVMPQLRRRPPSSGVDSPLGSE
jgi:aryl-alcohol dehydrogenase